MKKLIMVAGMAALAGCAFSPETMPMTQRDQAVYVDQGAPKRDAESRARVAVRASAGSYKQYAVVGEAMASTLNDKLSKFAFFDLIDRGAIGAIVQEQAASAEDPTEINLKGVESDFVVIAKIASVTTRASGSSTAIDARFDFSWVSMGEGQKVIMKKSVKPTVRDAASHGDVEGILVRAAEKAATEFALAVSSRYAPPARVMQTRGDGQAARINIGDDYGLTVGMEIEFYEIVDNSALGGDARDNSIIARGEVKSVEPKAAWVKVADFDKVNVRKGTYVRILEQKEGFGGKLMEKTGLNEML